MSAALLLCFSSDSNIASLECACKRETFTKGAWYVRPPAQGSSFALIARRVTSACINIKMASRDAARQSSFPCPRKLTVVHQALAAHLGVYGLQRRGAQAVSDSLRMLTQQLPRGCPVRVQHGCKGDAGCLPRLQRLCVLLNRLLPLRILERPVMKYMPSQKRHLCLSNHCQEVCYHNDATDAHSILSLCWAMLLGRGTIIPII